LERDTASTPEIFPISNPNTVRTYVGVIVYMNTEVGACLMHGSDAGVDYHRVDSVGDRRKSSGSRTMTSGLMSGKISGVEAVSRSKNST
jgi:hypothetical protein